MKNPEKKKLKRKFREDHDEKTCFRCRLHALWEELGDKHDNEPRFVLIALAEAAGSILAQGGNSIEDVMLFMGAVQKFANDPDHEEDDEGKGQTRH
jgi:hypothetical protein